MAQKFTSLAEIYAADFDDVIDVRSPAEFAEDHLPGAISLPVLSNAQRAEVGTLYTQVSPFKARKIGAALVARNAAAHIEGPLADRDGAWRPLVYCWRRGQRWRRGRRGRRCHGRRRGRGWRRGRRRHQRDGQQLARRRPGQQPYREEHWLSPPSHLRSSR